MDEQLLTFAVGAQVPPPFFRVNGEEGAVLELGEDGQAFICLYLNDLDEKIAEMIRVSPIESAYYNQNAFWVGMLKIGDFLAELSFDPMKHFLAYNHFSADLFRVNRLVSILGVDKGSMILKAIRVATYPPAFLNSLYFTFTRFKPSEKYTKFYECFLIMIGCAPSEKCWQVFEKTGVFGE